MVGRRSHIIFNNYLACLVTCFREHFLLEVNCLTKEDPAEENRKLQYQNLK